MERVKVSSKYQIVLPESIREQRGIKAGDHLIVEMCDGTIVLRREPQDIVRHMRGLHKEVWEGVDVEAYLDELRGSWER